MLHGQAYKTFLVILDSENISLTTDLPENMLHFRTTFVVSCVDNKPKQRSIVFYKDYFNAFFVKQREKVKTKIVWTLNLIEELEKVPETYLKHIENTEGLFEVRVQQGSDIFRIFCFFDKGQLVVLANGFQKKTQKTPKKEIDKALKIKMDYENEKK